MTIASQNLGVARGKKNFQRRENHDITVAEAITTLAWVGTRPSKVKVTLPLVSSKFDVPPQAIGRSTSLPGAGILRRRSRAKGRIMLCIAIGMHLHHN